MQCFYHLICTVDPASHTALASGVVIVTELAKTNCNAAERDKTASEDLNIIINKERKLLNCF